MLKLWVFAVILLLFTSSVLFPRDEDISKAIKLISEGNYSNAVKILLEIPRTQANERSIDYYLCESYFLMEDFVNSLKFGERLVKRKDDFIYKKSLYNTIFSAYMLNDFSRVYRYGSEYLENIGDSQGVETLVLTMVFTSLQSLGKVEEAKSLLGRYQDKYINLYHSLLKSLEKFEKEDSRTEKGQISEYERVRIYSETLRDILDSLEKISSKRDMEIEKLKDVIELLELKEEVLKIKKYQMLMKE
ncbi:MAG: hypothetical protein ABDH28_02085 [Brevinematia bacterium]